MNYTQPTRYVNYVLGIARPNMSAAQVLAQSALFRGIEPIAIRAVLEQASPQRWTRGTWLYRQEQPATHLFLLYEGRVGAYQLTADGQEFLLRLFTPGEVFGYKTLTDDPITVTSARAVQDCSGVFWKRKAFLELMIRHPRLALNAAGMAVGMLVESDRRYQSLVCQTVQERIATSLNELAVRIGRKQDYGILINGFFLLKDLADLAGTTIYSVSRILKTWERNGMVQTGRGRILIRDIDALRKIWFTA